MAGFKDDQALTMTVGQLKHLIQITVTNTLAMNEAGAELEEIQATANKAVEAGLTKITSH